KLLTGGLLVRIQPEEPVFARLHRASARQASRCELVEQLALAKLPLPRVESYIHTAIEVERIASAGSMPSIPEQRAFVATLRIILAACERRCARERAENRHSRVRPSDWPE